MLMKMDSVQQQRYALLLGNDERTLHKLHAEETTTDVQTVTWRMQIQRTKHSNPNFDGVWTKKNWK